MSFPIGKSCLLSHMNSGRQEWQGTAGIALGAKVASSSKAKSDAAKVLTPDIPGVTSPGGHATLIRQHRADSRLWWSWLFGLTCFPSNGDPHSSFHDVFPKCPLPSNAPHFPFLPLQPPSNSIPSSLDSRHSCPSITMTMFLVMTHLPIRG